MVVDHWTIGRRLYTGCGALLALTVLAGGVAIWGSSRIKGDLEIVTRRAAGLEHALSLQTSLFKIESREKTLLWAGLDNDWKLLAGRIVPDGYLCLHDTIVPPSEPWRSALESNRYFAEVIRHDARFELVETVHSLAVLRRKAQ